MYVNTKEEAEEKVKELNNKEITKRCPLRNFEYCNRSCMWFNEACYKKTPPFTVYNYYIIESFCNN